MIYDVEDKLKFPQLLVFGVQLLLSVFVATVLIANICGVASSGALIGAGCATLLYVLITGFKSPMFISNSGNFVAPVLAALAIAGYTGVAIGGVVTCLVYCLFGVIFSKVSVATVYKIFPKSLIGAVTAVIGIVLMGFIKTYIQIDGVVNMWGVSVAFVTMFAIALISHYAKGIAKILPFLLGLLIGYAYACVITLTGVYQIIDFSVFNNLSVFCVPDFAFMHWEPINVASILSIVVIYIAYSISAQMECLSDHAALGGIIGRDLYITPGLGRIYIGEGVANLASSFLGGLGCCSYGEGVSCVGYSKVASIYVTITAAVLLIILGFFAPLQAFIASIPSCAFAGAAIILYGFIASSGIRMLQKVDFNNQKNTIIVSSVLSLGISGIVVGGGSFSFTGTALALIVGIILNLILREDS